MKRIALNFIALGFVFSIMVIACKKDEPINETSYRISLEKYYTGKQQTASISYEYNDDKLIRKYQAGDGWSEEMSISYPEEDKIIVLETKIFQIGTYQYTLEITYTDSKVKDIYDLQGHRKIFHYNSDGTIDRIIDSAYIDEGYILEIDSYSYESGKLVQILKESPGYNNGGKSLFYYEGDVLKEIVKSSELDEGWFEMEKNTFLFTDGRVSNITHYYKNMDSWDKSISSNYSYDSNGNLLKVEKTYTGQSEKQTLEYVYESGSGNYQQIFYYLVYDNTIPMPARK